MSHYQQRAQMAMWAMFSAPLIMSNDLRDIAPEARQLLLNPLLIAVDQDPLGVMATKLYEVGCMQRSLVHVQLGYMIGSKCHNFCLHIIEKKTV